MNHRHRALSDEGIVEHAKWEYASVPDSPMVELIRRLSAKSYASQVAAYWAMNHFYLAAPMALNGQQLEGEATAFVAVWFFKGVIYVAFSNKSENTRAAIGGIDESERLIDAYVSRMLAEPAGP